MNGNAPRRMADVRLGKDACFDAWLYNLFIDNNLVHDLNPHIVASPEQLKFMVAGGPGSVYLPCSDALFALLCEPTMPRRLQKEYNRAWRILVRLVRSLVTDRMQRRALLLFCRYRFRSAVAQHTLLPPRLIKRMTNIVLAQGLGDGDPWRQRRHALNILQREILRSESVRTALEGMPVAPLPDTLEAARARLEGRESPPPAPPQQKELAPARLVVDLGKDPEALTDDQAALLRALQARGEQSADDLVEATGIPARRVLSALTLLQVRQWVAEAGRRFTTLVELKEERTHPPRG